MIELMVTVVFVTLGSFLIQGSFLRSAAMFGRYSHTLSVMDWMDADGAEMREQLLAGNIVSDNSSGSGSADGKPFQWTRELRPLDGTLNTIRYTVRWDEGGKPAEAKSEQYVYKDPLAG